MFVRISYLAVLAAALQFGGWNFLAVAQPVDKTADVAQQESTEAQPSAPANPPDEASNQPAESVPNEPTEDGAAQADGATAEVTPPQANAPTAESPTTETPIAESGGTESPMAEPPATPAPSDGQPTAETPTAEAEQARGTGINPVVLVAILVGVFVVPVLVGNFLATRLRMPDHGWRISLALGTILAAIVIISLGELRGGPDLVGGITLIYELEDPGELHAEQDPGTAASGTAAGDVDMRELIGALTRRINPSGTKEVTIREYGAGQVEIIVPKAGEDELAQLKNTITNLGQLEFRIVASERDPEHLPIITKARGLTPYEKEVVEDGKLVARWVPYNVDEFGPFEGGDPYAERAMVKRIGKDRRDNDVPETLVLIDDLNVTGGYLEHTSETRDQAGRPAVRFVFDSRGAALFGRLTGRNLPNEATGRYRYLGILLNHELQSAPRINSKIDDEGVIEGDFTEEEVESLVNVLNAGRLPAELNPTPLSEEVVSPTLGAATVRQGAISIVVSLVAVLLFMLVYYRFAGLVACLALIANLILILGAMVLLKADFTLSGLAALVLTVGMSVDANVLVFERIREELSRGAALRMAIRNGFDKAKSAIYDSNITTVLTGIVLFWIGTDQIKGFATTLIIGIVMSVYTALFVSRIVFEIAERQGWIRDLKMMRMVGTTNFDFLKLARPTIAASLILITIGLIAAFVRGRDLLNIDFTGGVSASMVLRQDAPMSQAEVAAALEETDLGGRNLLVVEQREIGAEESDRGRRFMVYARFDDAEIKETSAADGPVSSVQYVQQIMQETFGERLQTYAVTIENVEQPPESEGVFAGGTEATIVFEEPVAYSTVEQRLGEIVPPTVDGTDVVFTVSRIGYAEGSAERFRDWTVRMNIPTEQARPLLGAFESEMDSSPLFPLANRIGGQVAGDMQRLAGLAIFFSLLCIVGYIWLRFQQVMFGLAAVIALVHDVLVTIGMLALSAWVVEYVPPLASALQLEPFQIGLQIVAALLTIIGYSLNDTIVIFDRIREVRGKSPVLTAEMINTSVNQTLSRTLLTGFTTFIVVAILYFFGGPGIHGFAFSLVIGVVAGVYSTVFIASPALLWMSRPSQSA